MASQEDKILDQHRSNLLIALGKRIQELREKQGLSQVDLASRMLGKFDTTNISRIESGRTNATIFTLHRIALALEIPIKQLLEIDLEN